MKTAGQGEGYICDDRTSANKGEGRGERNEMPLDPMELLCLWVEKRVVTNLRHRQN